MRWRPGTGTTTCARPSATPSSGTTRSWPAGSASRACAAGVEAFGYGNQDVSGGIDRFWLGSSLVISPDEEVDFLGRLYAGELPVSARSRSIVEEILLQDPPAPGLVYSGKTGSCRDEGAHDPHGWWVGSVAREGRLYLFAALIEGPGASGAACRPMAEKALGILGIFPR